VPISTTVVMVCATVKQYIIKLEIKKNKIYNLICYNAQDASENGYATSKTRVMQESFTSQSTEVSFLCPLAV